MARPFLVSSLLLSLVLSTSCSEGESDRVRLFHDEPSAPSLTGPEIEALDHLGSTIVDKGVNFGVYSSTATRIDLLLFDDPEDSQPTRRYEMTKFGEVWNVYIEGIGRGQHYGFIAWGENWPVDEEWFPGSIHGFIADVDDKGNRFNPNKLLHDPYARALHRDHDWGQGSVASGPARTESTFAAGSKSIVWSSEYEWGASEVEWRTNREAQSEAGYDWSDAIIYEVHAKGFTASPASGVTNPGTYDGLAEKASYFSDLGVTAVELMPIHEKPLNGTYWGYMTLNFFAPELSYAATPRPLEVVDEFKAMVEAMHKEGIEVYVDVVYNHTGEGGLWRELIQQDDTNLDPNTGGSLVNFDPKEVASLYSFRGLDNQGYYALSTDNQAYWNNTGVGNQTRPNNRPMRRLIMDSLRFYVEELHVDGFRFDLAPILGERDMDYNNWDDPANTVLQDILDDPILQRYNTRIIAEPWSAGGNYGVKLGAFPLASGSAGADGNGWHEWNANFRDWWRNFINDDQWKLNSKEGPADLGFTMTGSYDFFSWNQRRPYHSVNFITAHDGFTMYDLVSYDAKQNSCGPLNPVCCDEPNSAFCDRQSGESNNRSRDWGQENEALKRQLMRNLFVGMLISHGTPMLLGGDEWIRTQLGNNNAYSTGSDNEFNWFDWGSWQANNEKHRMHDFVRKMIALRKELGHAFTPKAFGESAPFAWKNAANSEPVDWNSRHLMMHYYDKSAGAEVAILINMETGPVDFTLPADREWKQALDTQAYFDETEFIQEQDPKVNYNIQNERSVVPGSNYQVTPRSIVILISE